MRDGAANVNLQEKMMQARPAGGIQLVTYIIID
jgi:hypothetical protein